jgi:wyosine [tRNA(Phe)-imidazoG37] synthetase (radical SAM superfamily)
VGGGDCTVDYISFVPDGEPTLDQNLGTLISLLKKELCYPVAVITNGSLLWRDEVAEAVSLADWVSVKVDSVFEPIWRRINRPDRRLEFSKVLQGIRIFASKYEGELVSETMLVDQANTRVEQLAELADYLAGISPSKAYLSIPYRPTTEPDVRVPKAAQLSRARRVFENAGLNVGELKPAGKQFEPRADLQ